MSDKVTRAFLHGGNVELMRDLPHKARIMGRGGAAHQQAKFVSALQRRKACVPVAFNLRAGDDRDWIGLEMEIQRTRKAAWLPVFHKVAMRHLSPCVHTRIGSPRSSYRMGAWFELGQSRLDLALHGGLCALALPADEGRAVVFYLEGISGHGDALSDQGGKRQCFSPLVSCSVRPYPLKR